MDPKLPAASAAVNVTHCPRNICPADTPPKSASINSNGKAAIQHDEHSQQACKKFPEHRSAFDSRDIKSSSNVLRSFSKATDEATSSVENGSAMANCSGASIWKRLRQTRPGRPD